MLMESGVIGNPGPATRQGRKRGGGTETIAVKKNGRTEENYRQEYRGLVFSEWIS